MGHELHSALKMCHATKNDVFLRPGLQLIYLHF